VISFHPLLFPIARTLLAEPDYELEDYRASPDPLPQGEEPEIPKASVYIVEAHTRMSSTEAVIKRVSSRFPPAPLLVIGERFEEANAFPLLRVRVKGLVTYAEAPAQLARAVEAVSGGGFWMPRALLTRFVEATISAGGRTGGPRAAADLTRREQQVLERLVENLSNKDIAKGLGITERGVKFHVSNLLSKHGVRRRADLILLFLTQR